MNAPTIDRQQAGLSGSAITGMSRFLAFATTAGVIILPLIVIAIWMFPNLVAAESIGQSISGFELADANLTARSIGLAVALAGVALQVYGLLGLRRTFQESAQRRWCSLKSIQAFVDLPG